MRRLSDSARRKKIDKRQRLLSRLDAGNDDTLLLKVAQMLNYYPATRDSDITLSIKLLKTYYPSFIQPDNSIHLDDLYKIPKFYDMQRHRAKLQNSYGLFQASPEVRAFRKKHEFQEAEKFSRAVPDFSPIFVFADESGKNNKYLLIGSLWIYSIEHHSQASKSLNDWRKKSGYANELHFKDLKDDKDVDTASQFFDMLVASTPLHAFKALVVRNDQIPTPRRLDALYDGFGEMLIEGIKSEVLNKRVSPPLTLHLTKDADPATDVLKIRELNRKLMTAFQTEFEDRSVTLDANKVNSAPSIANNLVQVADLFTGSLNRWLNQGITDSSEKPKDKFAKYLGLKFNWHFDENNRLVSDGDVCKIIYLNDAQLDLHNLQ